MSNALPLLSDPETCKRLYAEHGSAPALATVLSINETTVYRWLKHHGVERTLPAGRRITWVGDVPTRERTGTAVCLHHGETEFRRYGDRWRCRICVNTASREYQRANGYASIKAYRAKLVQMTAAVLGTACTRCGYNRCQRALHAHHVDPAEKTTIISRCKNQQQLVEELRKCVLVCANCHVAEDVHAAIHQQHTRQKEGALLGWCALHGHTPVKESARGHQRCLACTSEMLVERRRQVKDHLVACAGGSCRLCGYDDHLAGLQFHHLDPSEKLFGLSGDGLNASKARLETEFRKCLLLCGNCHAEVEADLHPLTDLHTLCERQHTEHGWQPAVFGTAYVSYRPFVLPSA